MISLFLGRFGIMMAQLALASILGGVLGIGLGFLVRHSAWLSQASIRFLRFGLWLPFLVCWAFPFWSHDWPPREGWFDPILWAGVALVVAAIPAVSLSTCYHFLMISRSPPAFHASQHRLQLVRKTILQALFISLISQPWLGPYGWLWFFGPSPDGLLVGCIAILLLLSFLLVLNLCLPLSFDQSATERHSELAREILNNNRSSILGAFVLALAFVICWHLLSKFLDTFSLIKAPLDVLEASYKLLSLGINIQIENASIWQQILVSTLEVVVGVALSGGAAILATGTATRSQVIRRLAITVLPFTYVVTIVVPLFFLNLGIFVGHWYTIVTVAFVSFFPFTHLLWSLGGYPFGYRILLALDDTLPFAFSAMLFGEAMNAVTGIGFFIVTSRIASEANALAAALFAVVLLILVSATLRWLVKRLYFHPKPAIPLSA